MAQNDLILNASVLFAEHAPQERIDAEHLEQTRRGATAQYTLGFPVSSDVEVLHELHETYVFENRVFRAPVEIVGDDDAGRRCAVCDRHQLFRFRVWKRPDNHTVNNAEDCRGRTDAQGESRDDSKSKAEILAHQPHPVTQIASGVVEESDAARVPAFFLTFADRTHLAQSGVTCLFG